MEKEWIKKIIGLNIILGLMGVLATGCQQEGGDLPRLEDFSISFDLPASPLKPDYPEVIAIPPESDAPDIPEDLPESPVFTGPYYEDGEVSQQVENPKSIPNSKDLFPENLIYQSPSISTEDDSPDSEGSMDQEIIIELESLILVLEEKLDHLKYKLEEVRHALKVYADYQPDQDTSALKEKETQLVEEIEKTEKELKKAKQDLKFHQLTGVEKEIAILKKYLAKLKKELMQLQMQISVALQDPSGKLMDSINKSIEKKEAEIEEIKEKIQELEEQS